MFQSFDDSNEKEQTSQRIASLRRALADGDVGGLVVPRCDEFQGEYVPAMAERLKWLTGFSGSAGTAVILQDKAAIFVDGRYTLQVREQVDLNVLEPLEFPIVRPEAWVAENLAKKAVLGFDPWLLTITEVDAYEAACQEAGGKLVPLAHNPIDALWVDQPAQPSGEIALQPLQFAGVSAAEKLAGIATGL